MILVVVGCQSNSEVAIYAAACWPMAQTATLRVHWLRSDERASELGDLSDISFATGAARDVEPWFA